MNGSVRHVVLVSVDAMRADFLEPEWPAPTLQQAAARGVVIPRLRTVAPSLTYPAHATLATGALPARHGVVYNRPFEPRGASGRWLWEAEHVRVPTLWEAVRDAGGTSAALTWPVTVGAPIDWNVPEVWDPAGTTPQLEVLARHTTPPELMEELRRDVTGLVPRDAFRGYDLIRSDLAGAIGAHLLESRKPNLLAVHLVAVDAQQHEEGRDGPGVRRAVAAADRAVGRMVEAAERAGIAGETAFIATGDHGFVDVSTLVAPNVWLAEAGLRPVDPTAGDWTATFHVADGAAFLHVSEDAGAEGSRRAREVLSALPSRVRRLFRQVERPELDRLGASPDAELALSGRPGVAFAEDAEGSAVRPGAGGAHGHFPDLPEIAAALVAWGPGLGSGIRVPEAELTDVAPLVAHLLGVSLPARDGILLEGMLDDG